MASKLKKVEIHRLTISGLPEGTGYGNFLRRLRGNRPVAQMVLKCGEKSHALNDVTLQNSRLRLRFLSFTRGHRPDVLDTNRFSLAPNPLSPTQTSVEWTHILGMKKSGRYLLFIERNFNGIWPSTLRRYLQWVVDEFYVPNSDTASENDDPITINLEAEPGPEFLQRINALDKISEATVRIVRPNPGWRDLQSILGEEAAQSDARKLDLTMNARRGASLNKRAGIIEWIRRAFSEHELGFAAIRGRKGGQRDAFDTEKLGKHIMVEMELDDRQQVIAEDAWRKLSEIADETE